MIELVPDIPMSARTWRNHPDIYRWCRQHTVISHAAHVAWLQKIESDQTIHMYGIRHEKQSVGVCGFTSIMRQNSSAEFSLYIAPGHQKKGFGKKALETLIMHGFNEWGFNRIWGEVIDGNPAICLFEEIGFRLEGVLRETYFKAGDWHNSHIISVLAKDFLGKRA